MKLEAPSNGVKNYSPPVSRSAGETELFVWMVSILDSVQCSIYLRELPVSLPGSTCSATHPRCSKSMESWGGCNGSAVTLTGSSGCYDLSPKNNRNNSRRVCLDRKHRRRRIHGFRAAFRRFAFDKKFHPGAGDTRGSPLKLIFRSFHGTFQREIVLRTLNFALLAGK